jgi:hypothetical protein
MHDILDLRTAEKLTGIDYQVIRLHILKGYLPAEKFVGRYMIKAADLQGFAIRYRAGGFDGRRS